MKDQLELVAKSYDRAIISGRKGIDSSKKYPQHITNDPDYPIFLKATAEGLGSDSGRKEVKDYLSPATNMKYVDLGCCLNLMFRGYNEWPSIYYGVDISSETIKLLEEFVAKNNLSIGSLFCGSIHKTPFDDNSFDIGACIGVFEYFEKNYVEKALLEVHRIMKYDGRFVLDIPDNENSMRRFMGLIEEHRGCPTRFDMSPQEFYVILKNYFEVDKFEKIDSAAMIQYFVKCKK